MKLRKTFCTALTSSLSALAVTFIAGVGNAAPEALVTLHGNVPEAAIARAARLGPLDTSTPIRLAITLPLRNQADLANLLQHLYTPGDPQYGHYLSASDFAEQFGPTQSDYNAVEAFASAHGLQVVGTHPNRTILDVSGSAATVEAAFGVQLVQLQSPEGRVFHAPDRDPSIPESLSTAVSGIVGLDDAEVMRTASHPVNPLAGIDLTPAIYGTGPNGGLSPADTKTAYNLLSSPLTGAGQTLGLFELDGYLLSDITAFESYFGITSPPTLTNVLVDNPSGIGSGQDEVTLDIDMLLELAPNASSIIVYEAPDNTSDFLDLYNRIASDNLAKEISTSWLIPDETNASSLWNGENSAFTQMAAQGQTIFAASGDAGAYGSLSSTLAVSDPASQPMVVSVGGTNLSITSSGSWLSETSWADPSDHSWPSGTGNSKGTGGGGGRSTVWSIPSYQSGFISTASLGSTMMRSVPDVSLYGDFDTGGYAIVLKGAWANYNGTSAAAPLWAAFTALVNQNRAASGLSTVGFLNPSLYQIASTSHYSSDFHDIADGSTNLYFPAVTGYDLSTGLGSFNGLNLLSDLSSNTYVSSGNINPEVVNGNFGVPLVANVVVRSHLYGGTVQSPSNCGWTWTENAGIAGNNSQLGNGSAPTGQAAFVQSANHLGTYSGTVSQSIYFPVAGNYQITFQAATVLYASMWFSVDGHNFGNEVSPSGTAYQTETIPFTVTAGLHTIGFAAVYGSGGYGFIDQISIAYVPN